MTDDDTHGAEGEPPPGRLETPARAGWDADSRHPAGRLRRALTAPSTGPVTSPERAGGGDRTRAEVAPPEEDFTGPSTVDGIGRVTRRTVITGVVLAALVGAAAASLALSSTTRHHAAAVSPGLPAAALPAPPPLRPSARDDAAMAYDPSEGRVILFGGLVLGSEGLSTLSDTWSWDGSGWVQLHPAVSPPGLSGALLGYDPSTGLLVLTGGDTSTGEGRLVETQSTWTWDGSSWTQQVADGLPPSELPSALATDSASGQLILLTTRAGCQGTDTWRWGGSAWEPLDPSTSPPPADSESLVYDPGARTLDLFTAPGGCDGAAPAASTAPPVWSWDGIAWSPGATPPATVLSGAWEVTSSGTGALVVTAQGTYLWGGRMGGLSQLSSSPAVGDSAVAYDAADGQVVLFGGMCAGCGGDAVPDTWTWDGSWTLRDATAPAGRGTTS
jgi:hypothetical protein